MARNRKTPGSYKRRGDSIRVTLTFNGERHRFTVRTTDLATAKRHGSQRYAELVAARERALAGRSEGVLFSELIADFERIELPKLAAGTARSYRDSLKPIRSFFLDARSNVNARQIRPRDVQDYLAWRRENRLNGSTPIHPRTLQKDRAVLHRLFELGMSRDELDRNPVRKDTRLRPDKHDAVILDDAQYARLLQEASREPMLHLFILLLGETGMRCESEALHVRWCDVSMERQLITVKNGRDGHRTKSGKTRQVPITEPLMDALRSHFAEYRFGSYDGQRPEYVIHHEVTRRQHTASKRVVSLRTSFKRIAECAGLPREFRQHDLRHRRVTTWLAEGQNPPAVQMAMGHSDLRTTMGYLKLLPEHVLVLLQKTGRPMQPGSRHSLSAAS